MSGESEGCTPGPTLPTSAPRAMVKEWTWVTVVNQRVSNCNGPFVKGETCGIEPGGALEQVNVKGRTLLQYETPGNEGVNGSPCPSGTLFFKGS